MKNLFNRWARTNSVILMNTGSLVGTTASVSILNFVYWCIAVRWFSPQAIGISSAIISAMKMLGVACVMGVEILLMVQLPRQWHKTRSLVEAILIVTAGLGLCVGTIFALAAPFITGNFPLFRGSFIDIALFAAGVSLTCITLILNQAFIGFWQRGLHFWNNFLFSCVKITLLAATILWFSRLVEPAGLAIYAVWVISNLLSLVALTRFVLFKWNAFRNMLLPEWRLVRNVISVALQYPILTGILQAPTLALPLLVAVVLSPSVNALFYIAWICAGILFVISAILVSVLYALISGRADSLAQQRWNACSMALLASVLTACLALLAGRYVLSLFGQAYAEKAIAILRILSLGAFPIIIKNQYALSSHARQRTIWAILFISAASLFELGAIVMGAYLGGLLVLSLSWVVAVWVEATFMSRTIYINIREL